MIIDNIEMIVYKNHIYPIIEGMMWDWPKVEGK